jgi:hypothetical protein
VEGVGLFTSRALGYGTESPSDLGHVPKVFRLLIKRLPKFTEPKATLSVDIVRVEFNLNSLLNNVVHISGFCGEDGRIVELNVVSVVDTVFSYGQVVRMF